LVGAGIVDSVKNAYHGIKKRVNILLHNRAPPDEPSPAFIKFLNSEGNKVITNLYVTQLPVQEGVTKFLNLITLGKLDATRAKLGYDQIVHDAFCFQLGDSAYIVEKNHVVQSRKVNINNVRNKILIPLYGRRITLKEFIIIQREETIVKNM